MATNAMARSVLFAALCLVAATSVAAIPSGTYTLTSEVRAKNECNFSKYVPTAGTLLGFRNQSCSTAGPIARTPGTTWTYWRITVRDVLADGSSVAELHTFNKQGLKQRCPNGRLTPTVAGCSSDNGVGLGRGAGTWRIVRAAGSVSVYHLRSATRAACGSKYGRYLAASSSCNSNTISLASEASSNTRWTLTRVSTAPSPTVRPTARSPPPPAPPTGPLVPSAPVVLKASPAGPTAATVIWSTPTSSGSGLFNIILGYKVVCSIVGFETTPGYQNYTGASTVTTGPGGYTGLAPNTYYTCQVLAYNSYGDGPLSGPSDLFITAATPPPPPPPVAFPPPPPAAAVIGTPILTGVAISGGAIFTITPYTVPLGGVQPCLYSYQVSCFQTGTTFAPIVQSFSYPYLCTATTPFAVTFSGLSGGLSYSCYASGCTSPLGAVTPVCGANSVPVAVAPLVG